MKTAINWYLTAATMRSAFELRTREDGSEFWALTPEARQTPDDLAIFIGELHDGELPNDWRYRKIVEILDAIVETSKYNEDPCWSDEAPAIADQLTCIYTAELAAWIGENGNRASYHDEAMEEGCVSPSSTLADRLQVNQFCCIRQMVDQIMSRLELI